MMFHKNESLGVRKERLVHKTGHAKWINDAACEK